MKVVKSLRSKFLICFALMFLISIFIFNFIPDSRLIVKIPLMFGLCGAYLLFGNYLLGRWVILPLRKCILFSAQSVGNDFSDQLTLNTNDEFVELAGAVNDMLQNLRLVLQEDVNAAEQLSLAAAEMCSLAEQVNGSTQEITGTVEQMAVLTSEQYQNVQMSVAAIQQMTENAQQVAEEAQKAANFSSEASEKAKVGEENIQMVHTKIMQLKETVDGSAKVVRRLGNSSAEIGKIVDVMRGISRQTNLLALNAAIEAARAGEHGRGFSVVADEVRVLAEQSTNSATQIVSLINDIQTESQKAVEAMEIGTKAVDEGTAMAINAKEAFSHITAAVNQTVDTIHGIAAASEEQAAGSREISTIMRNVVEVSKQNVTGSNQVATSSKEQRINMEYLASAAFRLTEMADRLTALVGRFKAR